LPRSGRSSSACSVKTTAKHTEGLITIWDRPTHKSYLTELMTEGAKSYDFVTTRQLRWNNTIK
jgi:arginine/lysine/ornithine decarboxylase